MKVRFTSSSLRVRLSPSDVARLCAGDAVDVTLVFGPDPAAHRFAFALTTHTHSQLARVEVAPGSLRLSLPDVWLLGWADDTREGFELDGARVFGATTGAPSRILIQKDYACTRPASEGDARALELGCDEGGERFERVE